MITNPLFYISVIQKNGRYGKDTEFGQWLAWANNYANNIDPLN